MKPNILAQLNKQFQERKPELMSLDDYLEVCKQDKMAYATAAERMLAAIGTPEIVNTVEDPRLSRIFLNRTIRRYPSFKDFYGMEETIERIVGFFTHAAQGLEERKQVLYLLGPVGGGKSSIAERLKLLMEKFPIYVLADQEGKLSPVLESPLGLFNAQEHGEALHAGFGIESRYLNHVLSPWALKRIEEHGSANAFKVAKIWPSKLTQIGIVKTEPGDENNQDISSLTGKTNIRMIEHFDQNDPDSYSFSGALCRGNQGLVEFVEMFKAPIKMLHPLLTATQEGNYMGTEAITAIPFSGIILAHSNESEWLSFKENKNNQAFLDRIFVVKVPYCLRVKEEVQIYKKMLESSSLNSAPCAPETLDMLAKFCVLSRLHEHENSTLFSKMRVYDGEMIKDIDPKAKSMQEYKENAGVDEGMEGISTRFAFKVLSQTFNYDPTEVSADPVHLMNVLEDSIRREQFQKRREDELIAFIKEFLAPKYVEFIGTEIQKAYLESYKDYGQNLFDRYIEYADAWIQEIDFKDPDTGNLFDREVLNAELEKIEKAAEIANPKDFRHEVVNFVLRAKAKTNKPVAWTSYEKLREVIEKKMFKNTSEILPVVSFSPKSSSEDKKKHEDFINRMVKKGYTPKMVKRLVEWYSRTLKA